jgi:hypothetical protein
VLTALAVAPSVWSAPATGPATHPTEIVNPAAMEALGRMAAHLRSLKTYRIDAAVECEDVLDDGLKIQYPMSVSVLVRRPDGLLIKVSSDRQDRQYFYNGKTFTLWARRLNLYATVPAPPTIAGLIDTIETKLGIELPLVDLFRWGTDADPGAGITAAVDAGPATISGVDCRHYAFRQADLDWQIWIQTGGSPLPRRLVLTTTRDEARPQYQSTYTWTLDPAVNESDFVFNPPAEAKPIVFHPAVPDTGAAKEEK